MEETNGGSLIARNDQFMGLDSVEERFNDEQDNLLTKSDLRQIKKPHEEEFNSKQNMKPQEERLLNNDQGNRYPQ
jgi:hypothetical protein